MLLNRFALIAAISVAAAGLTVCLGLLAASLSGFDESMRIFAIQAVLAVTVAIRLIARM